MQESLLSTKLFIPQVSQKMVHRSRLIDRLNQSLAEGAKLTLISAPAGYGKTTLITEWLNRLQEEEAAIDLAWLSLDEADNNLPRFLTYLIAAFQQIDQDIGAELQPILQSDADVPHEPILTALVNDIADRGATSHLGSRHIIVLDDYYLINEFRIHEVLDFLIDHIPPCLHMVILTRIDPPIPLGRLRVLRELSEFRQIDLQFNNGEATVFLNRLMGLNLSRSDISILNDRTEGWIAGLQLAALSLQGRADKHDRITSFSGSHRHLVDYLAHEVMSRQNEEVRSFLLQTSILERFNVSLCDAVTGLETYSTFRATAPRHSNSMSPQLRSREIIDHLDVSNLFLVALDDNRHWYRYHHLFADFLYKRLLESQPEIIPVLFTRASQWYESQGMVDEAISHALAGGDVVRSARLLDENVEAFIFNAEILKIIRLANDLPLEVRARFPRLCIFHAWALQFELRLDSVETALVLAEAHLPNPDRRSKNFTNHQLLGHAKAVRAYIAIRERDPIRAIALSRSALEELPKEETKELLTVAGAAWLGLGIAYQELGQVEGAVQSFSKALSLNQQVGNYYGILSCMTQLLQVNAVRGKLFQAAANGTKGLLWIEEWSRAEKQPRRPVRMLAFLRLLMSEVQYEWNDVHEALTNLQKACDYYALVKSWHRFVCQAHFVQLYQAMGDVDKALEWLYKLQKVSHRAEQNLQGIPLAVWITERCLLLSQLRPDLSDLFAEATYWAKNSGLNPDDVFTGELKHEYIALSRVLIAENRGEQAIPLLERLSQSAEHDGRWGDLISILLLQTLAYKSLDNMAHSFSYLSRALELSEPEGYIRSFVDLGPPMRGLLQSAARKDISRSYAAKLLTAFPAKPSPGITVPDSRLLTISPSQIEPLNEREMQILRLMSARLTNREIAEELYLSVNTVKWYARSIYEKLGVSNRRDAGSRGRDLGIF